MRGCKGAVAPPDHPERPQVALRAVCSNSVTGSGAATDLARRRPISRLSQIDPLYRQTAMGIGFGLLIAIVLASAFSAMVPPPSGSVAQQLVAAPLSSETPGTTVSGQASLAPDQSDGSGASPSTGAAAPTLPLTPGSPDGGPSGAGVTTPGDPTAPPDPTVPTAAPPAAPTQAPTTRPTAAPTPRPTRRPRPRLARQRRRPRARHRLRPRRRHLRPRRRQNPRRTRRRTPRRRRSSASRSSAASRDCWDGHGGTIPRP